jgi:lysozyme
MMMIIMMKMIMNKIANNTALTTVAVVVPCGLIIAAAIIIIRRNTNLLDKITGDMRTSTNGINRIKEYEGVELTSYKDTGGVWTIGYGHISGVKEGDTCTLQEAENYLKNDLRTAENAVNSIDAKLTQNQFDALVSICYNIGVSAFKKSTLYKKVQADPTDETIKQEFTRWQYDNGKVIAGLLNRRNKEAQMYFA